MVDETTSKELTSVSKTEIGIALEEIRTTGDSNNLDTDNYLPEGIRFKKELIHKMQIFKGRVLEPWLTSSQIIRALVEKDLPLTTSANYSPLAEDTLQNVTQEINRLYSEAIGIESGIAEGSNPWIINEAERRSKLGSIKRLVPGYARKKDTEAVGWLNEQQAEVQALKDAANQLRSIAISNVLSSVRNTIEETYVFKVERNLQESEKWKEKKIHPAELMPEIAIEISNSLSGAQEQLGQLTTFIGQSSLSKTEKEQIEKQMADLQGRISERRQSAGRIAVDRTGEVVIYAAKLAQEILKVFNEPYFGGSGLLEKFLMIPSNGQALLVEELNSQLRSFLAEFAKVHYEVRLAKRNVFVDNSSIIELAKFPDQINRRRKEYQQMCEALGAAIVCHRSPRQTALEILRDGKLRSSSEIRHSSGKRSGNSKATVEAKRPLLDVSFSINGIEDQYGWTWEENIYHHQKIRREGRWKRGGLVFAFRFEDAVAGKPFYIQNDSQGKQKGHPDYHEELHVQAKGYDASPLAVFYHSIPPDVDISLDRAVILIPEEDKETYTELFKKSREDGGVGRDPDWIEHHVIFYSRDTDPSRVVDSLRYQRKYRDVELPKERGGYFHPFLTRRGDVAQALFSTGDMTHLFEWVKAA